MKIFKKILAIATTLALSVSAMAFTMTASAEEYKGKTYDKIYSTDSYDDVIVTAGEKYCIPEGVKLSPDQITLNGGCTLDVYGELYSSRDMHFCENTTINVYGGTVSAFSYLTQNGVSDCSLTINNYNGEVKCSAYGGYFAPEGTVNQMLKNITPNTTEAADKQGTIKATTKTIPAPEYTVTIPEAIDFGECEKALENDSDEDRLETVTENVVYEAKNLDVNEKILTVNVTQINPLKATVEGTAYTIDYTLKTNETSISSGYKLIEVGGKDSDNVIAETQVPITATFDKSDIEVAGDYVGSVVFTISMTDEEGE